MDRHKYHKIKNIFYNNNGFARTKDIAKHVHPRYLYKLVEKGKVEKVKRGLYCWQEDAYSTEKEMVKVVKIVPKGVVCLLSALSFHEISTINPWEYQLAIHRDAHKPALPDYPPISIFYYSQRQFETGIENFTMGNGESIRVYDIEKTVCDCIRYRNKIGKDIVKEAMNEYVNRKDCNIDKLLNYAKTTRISGLVKTYLEVLV